MNSIKDFLDFLKLPPNILAALAIASGLILFLPEDGLRMLHVIELRDNFGYIIGPIFIVSTVLLAVLLLSSGYKAIATKFYLWRAEKHAAKYLLNADGIKVEVIKTFLADETHTIQLPMNDGLVIELSHLEMISLAGNTQMVHSQFGQPIEAYYFLQPWVVSLIQENPELCKKYKANP